MTMITVNSFRGGTGKSSLTANLAAQLAILGKRVGIVDSDFISPSIHVIFGIDENNMGRTLNEYQRGECTIEEIAYRVGSDHNGDSGLKSLLSHELWFLPAAISPKEIAEIGREGYDVNRFNAGLQTFRRQYQLDYLLIDTHPGLNEEVLLSIAFSEILIIVLRPSQQDFQGTAVVVDVAASLDVPSTFLVVNQVLKRYDLNQVGSTVQDFYKSPILGVIPMSNFFMDYSYNRTGLFSITYPHHKWSTIIKEMSETILKTEF